MERKKKMVPIGIEDFGKLRTNGYYYVDKTGLIRELLSNRAEVTLFTRPRRFGKSLNMSMLANFFSLDGNKQIFEGLAISKETGLCEKYMGKYPVISISLKRIDALDYETAFRRSVSVIRKAARKAGYLLESSVLSKQDKAEYQALLDPDMTEASLGESLEVLSELLEKHHGTRVILLIDEYDVPLASAYKNGYYDQMVSLIRSLLGEALKSNDSLEFAVLTGCLRIAKESIFTGLNRVSMHENTPVACSLHNLKVISITDTAYDEFFGFTDGEVKELLDYYELGNTYNTVQEWYDGCRFGNADVYCPWDVLNYCFDIRNDSALSPQNYWANSSGSDAVREFVRRLNVSVTAKELEELAASVPVRKEIRQEITCREMYETTENLWSLRRETTRREKMLGSWLR